MLRQPLPWLAQHSGYCSTGGVGVYPQSAAPDLCSAAKDTLINQNVSENTCHCLALLCVEQRQWCCCLHMSELWMNNFLTWPTYYYDTKVYQYLLTPLLLRSTHPVGRAVGLLRGRGLVLGWTPETHTVVWWAINIRDSFFHFIWSAQGYEIKQRGPGCSCPSSVKPVLTLRSVCCHGVCGTSLWLFQQWQTLIWLR